MLAAGAREAEESGAPPPFHVRPALIAEMLALYDHIRRLGRTRGRLRSAADRRARAGGRIGSRRGAAAGTDAIPVRGVPRLRSAPASTAARVDEHGARAHLSSIASRQADAARGRRDRRSAVRSGRLLARRCDAAHDHPRPRAIDILATDGVLERVTSIGCGWRLSRSKKIRHSDDSRAASATAASDRSGVR